MELQKRIKNKILENYTEYLYLFVQFQSEFISGLYKRYQGVENGNLVLYYAKIAHQDILRQKDYDLNFDLGFKNFWENHKLINPQKHSIQKVANDTSFAKETARRKILELIRQNVLSKKNKIIAWLPNEQHKESYNLFIHKEIEELSKLAAFVCKKIDLSISKEEITEEIKKNFSFYWFHYLGAQLEYLRLWNKQFKEIELIHIFLQVSNVFVSKEKKKILSHKNLNDNSSLLKDYASTSISATSVSDVTGIPRASCMRKLEYLTILKLISQDRVSKRYYFIPNHTQEGLVSRKINEKVVKIFSQLFFIFISSIEAKTSS